MHKTFVDPSGTPRTYDIIDDLETNIGLVIALTPENKVLIAEQFRPGPENVFQELPGGFCEPGEDPQAAAVRELHEETGYVSEDVSYLGRIHKNAYSNATWYYYLAKNCVLDGPAHNDVAEYVDVKKISITQLIENAKSDKMSDCGGVFLAYEILKEMEKNDGPTN